MATKHEAEALVAPSAPEEAVNNHQDENQSPRSLKDSTPSLFWRVERSGFGDNVLEVLQIASTLWPISFAAVLGPALKTLALHSAERGSRLGSLEFLLSSQTTFAALKNLVMMQHLNIWTIGIGVLWCLGPLGGQAAVRSLHLQPNSTTTEIRAMHYLKSNVSDIVRFYQGNQPGDDAGALWGGLDFNIIVHNFGGQDQVARLGRQDLWQNVRIPYLQLLPGYDAEKPYDWVSVPSDQALPYVSLVGIPIRGPESHGVGNFTLNPNGAKPNIFIDIVNSSRTMTDHNANWQGVGRIQEPTSKLELVIGGRCRKGVGEYAYMLRTCKTGTSYAEVGVGCTRLGIEDNLQCRAERVRHTPGRPVSGNLTAISSFLLLSRMIYEFPFITASYHIGEPSAIEKYLWDPPTSFGYPGRGPRINPGCFPDVPTEEFQARLSTALNTVIMATYNATVLRGGEGTSLDDRNFMWHNTTAEQSTTDDVYVLSRGWFAMAMMSTLVLLGCAVTNVAIRCFIKAPDFLDSVTGMTRDSPYILVKPRGGSGP
ncbi:hypothetical protein FALBO_5009 [Fusarium albosuccineum]|uniref:Uncharacterized protein n=1 Tax=Fusarium albosuccineum TaxID=1237068 RepID=A0A8H4LHK8_9HYPO|nr:hypothetical protein FALBO_5009 [Fusarium albosuccineum]